MLGHKKRFSKEFNNDFEFLLSRSFSDLNYKELFVNINKIEKRTKDDLTEFNYLNAKLSVILANFGFIKDNNSVKISIENDEEIGFQIYKIYGLLLQNKTDLASELFVDLKLKLPKSDILLFGDYLLTLIFLYYIQGKYQEITKIFKIYRNFLELLPEEASFTKYGIIYFTILTYFVLGDNNTTRHMLKDILKPRTPNIDLFFYSKLLNVAGRLELRIGKYEDAKKCFYNSLSISKAISDKIGAISRLQSIGSLERQLGNYTKSLKCYNEVKKLAESINDQINLSYAYFSSGKLLIQIDNLSDAEKELKIAIDLFSKGKNQRGILESYLGLGIISSSYGKDNMAIEYYKKSYDLAKEINLEISQASALNNIGLIYSNSGKYKECIEYYNKSLEINKNIDNKSEIFRVSLNLAEVYRRIGNIHQAMLLVNDFMDKSKNDKEINDLHADLYGTSAQLYFDLGNVKLAKEAAEKALLIWESLEAELSTINSLLILSRIFFIRNDTKNALKLLSRAIKTSEKNNSFGTNYQLPISNMIEFYLGIDEISKIDYYKDLLEEIDKKPNIQLSDIIKENLNFFNLEIKYKAGNLNYNELISFENRIQEKNFFFLELKAVLLKVKLNLAENDLSSAYLNLSILEELATEKQLIQTIIEVKLLKSLLLAKETDFESALSTCEELKNTIESNDLLFYQNRLSNVLNLIITAQESVSSLYELASDHEKKKEEELHTHKIPKEMIIDYLDQISRTIIADSES